MFIPTPNLAFYTLPSSVTYKYSPSNDGSIDKVAARYRTSVDEIRRLSAPLFEGQDISTNEKFKALLTSSSSVIIPVPAEVNEYHWEAWQFGKGAKYATVDKVCAALDADERRQALPKITGEQLLTSVVNTDTLTALRAAMYHADPLNTKAKSWKDRTSWKPRSKISILVPIPFVTDDIAVAVTPKAGTESTASPSLVEAAPPWLVTFYDTHLRPIDERLAELVPMNAKCDRIKAEASSELSVLGALTEAALMMRDSEKNHSDPIAWSKRNELMENMCEFTTFAHDFMCVDVISALEMPEATRRTDLAKDILSRVKNADFCKGVVKIFSGFDIDVRIGSKLRPVVLGKKKAAKGDKLSLKGYVILLLLHALQETAHSYAYEDCLKLVDGALSKIGVATKSGAAITPDSGSALSAVASVIGVVTMSVGDAPGPQALGMSLVAIAASWGPALSRVNFTSSIPWTGIKLTALAGRIAGMSTDEIGAFQKNVLEAATKGEARLIAKVYEEKVTAAIWQSPAWNIGMTVLASLTFLSALNEFTKDPTKIEAKLSLAASGSAFFAAALKTIISLDKGVYFATTGLATKLGNFAGGLAAGIGVAVAVLNAVRTYQKYGNIPDVWIQAGQAGAGLVVLVGFLMGCPFTQAFGTVLGLALLVYGYKSNEKSTFVGYLEAVGEDSKERVSRLKELMNHGRNRALEKAYKDVVKYAAAFDYYGEITNSKVNRDKLAALGFNPTAVSDLTSYLEVD